MSIVPSIFNKTLNTLPFSGFGISSDPIPGIALSNYINNFDNLTWSRIYLNAVDPGLEAIYYDDTAFDNLWINSTSFLDGSLRFTISILLQAGTNLIFTFNDYTTSFMANNKKNELIGDPVFAYARYCASAVFSLKTYFGINVNYVELTDNIDEHYITPENYVLLIQVFKQILSSRGITGVFVLAPGIDMMYSNQLTNNYVTIFQGTSGIIDGWSIHAIENYYDVANYQGGNIVQRMWYYQKVNTTANLMKRTIMGIPIYITKSTSISSKFALGIDYGPNTLEVPEAALRTADNICNMLNCNIQNIMFWYIYKYNDLHALMRNDQSTRNFTNVLEFIVNQVPSAGSLYNNFGVVNAGDQTLKACVVETNTYCVLLSRAQLSDSYNGTIMVQINNSNWNTTFGATISLSVYPSYLDITAVTKSAIVNNGYLSINLANLPYQSTIVAKGTVYPLNFTIPVVSQFESLSFPIVSVLPVLGVNGQTVYLVPSNILYCWLNNAWIQIQT